MRHGPNKKNLSSAVERSYGVLHPSPSEAFRPEDASFMRAASVRAAELRKQNETTHVDPGDAYLEGVRAAHAEQARHDILIALQGGQDPNDAFAQLLTPHSSS